jgi:sec-independent protein translocase protein TatB
MFDVGISELGVIGLVALIVIGPEQLPRVARTAGHLMGRLRRYVADVKTDITREMELADLQRIHDEVKDSARSIESSIREHVAGIGSELEQSVAINETHQLVNAPVMEATQTSADMFATESVLQSESQVDAPPTDVQVDPNQMDLFGAPVSISVPASVHVDAGELPEKH